MKNHYFDLPYDLSGSLAKNRFRNEILWGLEKLFELYKANDDFCMIFDYVCDIEVHFEESIECYQIKTNMNSTPYTINKIAKPDKTGKSILGKLYSIKSADNDNGIVSKLALVVNVPLKTLDNKIHSADEAIAFEALDEKTLKKIEEYLLAECGVDHIDLKDCYYIYTSMDLFNPSDSLLGKTINFFIDTYGEEPKRAKVLFQTIVDTIQIKACYERKCNSYEELVEKKGVTRSQFEEIISKAVSISDESIEEIKREVKSIYPEFSLRTKVNMAVVSMCKELKTNKIVQGIEKTIVQYIMENLEKFDGDKVDSINILEEFFKEKFPIEYTIYERHALYIILLVKIEEGCYE